MGTYACPCLKCNRDTFNRICPFTHRNRVQGIGGAPAVTVIVIVIVIAAAA
jgi:hypothetical protein